MPRDAGHEMLIEEALVGTAGVTKKPTFGGMAFMLNRNLVFGARKGSLLVRLGKGTMRGHLRSRASARWPPALAPSRLGARYAAGFSNDAIATGSSRLH
jgi:hypothetical protein